MNVNQVKTFRTTNSIQFSVYLSTNKKLDVSHPADTLIVIYIHRDFLRFIVKHILSPTIEVYLQCFTFHHCPHQSIIHY